MNARTAARSGLAARATTDADVRRATAPDWIVADALLVVFAVLVMLLLDVVPGWAAPLRAWLAFSTWLFAALSLHAFVQGAKAGCRRRWHRAILASACGAGLALAAAMTILLAQRLPADDLSATLDDAALGAGASR